MGDPRPFADRRPIGWRVQSNMCLNSDSARAETDAIPVRGAQAIERAARLLEPQVRPVALECATLRYAAEVEAWAERRKKALIKAVADGPVLVN